MDVENQDRRKFLKSVGLLSAGALFSGCASLDRWVMGEDHENPNRVLILGAGLAGLTCAYHLKKAQIPFLLVEGSSRVGGRVYSLSDFNSAAQVAELGGEWILPTHDSLIHLCKELNLELSERNWASQDYAVLRDGRLSEQKKLNLELKLALKDLQQKRLEVFGRGSLRLSAFNVYDIPKAKYLDQQNLAEYLRQLKLSQDLHSLFELSLISHYGVPVEKLSALSLFQLGTGTSSSFPLVEKAYRISAGASSLAQALTDRVAGVIPGRFLQTHSPLIEIGQLEDIYELKFQTPEGVKVRTAKTVICTLPLSVLRQVRGFQRLTFPDPVMKAVHSLQYGAHAKGAMSFNDRPWKKTLNLTRWSGLNSGIVYCETEPRVDRPALTPKSIVSLQLGGDSAVRAGLQTLDQAAKDFQAMKLTSGPEDCSQIYSWNQSPWSKGGVSFWGPGTASQSAGILADSGSSWIFAGEHVSLLHQGSMNGAIESAEYACRKLIQAQSKGA